MEHAYTSAFIRIKQLKDHLHKQKYERGSIFIILSTSEKEEKTQLYDTNSYQVLKVCLLAITTAASHFLSFQEF